MNDEQGVAVVHYLVANRHDLQARHDGDGIMRHGLEAGLCVKCSSGRKQSTQRHYANDPLLP
jgi:hypothetical protein